MTRRRTHHAEYRGLRWVTVACRCGWISQNHPSRGEAYRAYQGHVWIATRKKFHYGPVGVDAHRREPRGE